MSGTRVIFRAFRSGDTAMDIPLRWITESDVRLVRRLFPQERRVRERLFYTVEGYMGDVEVRIPNSWNGEFPYSNYSTITVRTNAGGLNEFCKFECKRTGSRFYLRVVPNRQAILVAWKRAWFPLYWNQEIAVSPLMKARV